MNKEIRLNLRSSFDAVKRNWWIIAIVTVITFAGGFVYTLSPRDNEYTASTTIYGAAYGSYTESLAGISAMQDYATLITTHKIADLVAETLGDPSLTGLDIKDMINVYEDADSAVMTITATANSPATAVRVSNAVAQTFADEVNKITGSQNVNILDKASGAELSFNNQQFTLVVRLGAAAAGLLLASAAIVLYVMFRDTLYSPEDATLGGRVTVIAAIPTVKNM